MDILICCIKTSANFHKFVKKYMPKNEMFPMQNQNSAESGVAPAPGWGGGGTGATSTSAMGKVLV